MVHRREVNGETVAFGNQGALWGNAMTWWDHLSGSVWSQPKGEAILGPLTGTTLDLLPSTLTTWKAWRQAHPDTQALDVHGWETGFALKDMAIVVDLGDAAVAYPIPQVRAAGVINDIVAGIPVAIVADPEDPDRWAVFSRQLDDRMVELAIEAGNLVDVATGSSFDPFVGVGRVGPLGDQQLDKLAAFTVFPKDFPTFFPGGQFWQQTS
jgi:hypothetical protein